MGTVRMVHFGIPRRSTRAEEEEPLAVNWRRGLFRVWLLFCAAWLMGWAIYLTMYGLHGGFKTNRELLEVPVLLLGPPIAMLLFGLAAIWAFRGFKAEKKPADE